MNKYLNYLNDKYFKEINYIQIKSKINKNESSIRKRNLQRI